MSLSKGGTDCSEADILAIEALFKRIAERGRKIRLQNSALKSNSGEDVANSKNSLAQAVVVGQNGQVS
jgi:hypothetical protein